MKALGAVLGVLAGAAIPLGLIALSAALTMLLFAGLHAYVWEGIPAIGFVGALLVNIALGMVGAVFKR